MTLSRAGLALSICLLPALACAQDAFLGQYELTGKYSNRRATKVELEIVKNPTRGYTIRRKGTFTSRRHRDTPPVEWTSRSVTVSDSGRVMLVTYTLNGTSARGLVNSLPDDASTGEAFDALTGANVFKGLYFLAADGQSLREVVANTTRLGDERWWRFVSAEGDRLQAPPVTTLSRADYEAIRDQVIDGWYLDDVREHYTRELADPSLSPDERQKLEAARDIDMDVSNNEILDGDWWFEQQLDERYDDPTPPYYDPYLDAHGRPIPKDALEPVTLSMFPEYAGIGLSKSFLFDTRTGELIDEGDIQD
jgi:hypothetical protein